MPLVFSADDEAYLVRRLRRAEVVLFLGAGFSTAATNRLGRAIPSTEQLRELLWQYLGMVAEPDPSSLGDLYAAALSSGRPHSELQDLLESQLLVSEYPAAYSSLLPVYWRRIFTTNVDDLVERIYDQHSSPRLQVLAYPHSDPIDRDQFLRNLQLVHLNGRLPAPPNDLTFSPGQYCDS